MGHESLARKEVLTSMSDHDDCGSAAPRTVPYEVPILTSSKRVALGGLVVADIRRAKLALEQSIKYREYEKDP